MQKINTPNTKKTPTWYEKWHDNDHHFIAHWGVFLLVVISVWAFLNFRILDWAFNLNEGVGVDLSIQKNRAQLSLLPNTKDISEGDTFTVNLMLDTGITEIDGVDIYSLHYDPSLLEVIDDVGGESGVQITPGKILALNTYNQVDGKAGNIKFAQVAQGGTSFTGKGILATIHFRALSAGTAYLKFDFTKGSTVDSNAAYKGKDRLDRVVDAIYTITPKN